MSHIKSALEIALEKSKKIDKLSPQELSRIKQQEKIDNILAKYYKDQIKLDELWQTLKGFSNKLLVRAQNNFIQSLTFQSNDFEISKRKNGILAIENLKENNQVSDIEFYLEEIKKFKNEYQKNKEKIITNLKEELERDPQKKLQTFQQGNQIMVKELSIEEVLEQNQQLKENLNHIEKQLKNKFEQAKEKLSELTGSKG
jgi:hypothetical protein